MSQAISIFDNFYAWLIKDPTKKIQHRILKESSMRSIKQKKDI